MKFSHIVAAFAGLVTYAIAATTGASWSLMHLSVARSATTPPAYLKAVTGPDGKYHDVVLTPVGGGSGGMQIRLDLDLTVPKAPSATGDLLAQTTFKIESYQPLKGEKLEEVATGLKDMTEQTVDNKVRKQLAPNGKLKFFQRGKFDSNIFTQDVLRVLRKSTS